MTKEHNFLFNNLYFMPALKKRKDNPLSFDETECAEVRTLCSVESVSVMKLFRTGLYMFTVELLILLDTHQAVFCKWLIIHT